jgi:8-oxo-dGTP pyrophosphatase MutT (NUDIX family)
MLWPVSVKGVVTDKQGRVCLLKNERDEWELPGGRLERGETQCLKREINEELSIRVDVGRLLDVWVYEVKPGAEVLIVTYRCQWNREDIPRISDEHTAMGWFDRGEISGLRIPEGYLRAIFQCRFVGPTEMIR